MGEGFSHETDLADRYAIVSRARRVLAAAVASVSIAAVLTCVAVASDSGHDRAWELITPSEPIGAVITNAPIIGSDGTKVLYASFGSLPGSPSGDLLGSTLATRGSEGWTSTPLGTPYSVKKGNLAPAAPRALSDDMTVSVWEGTVPLGEEGVAEGHRGLYRMSPDGHLATLADMGKTSGFIAASRDTSHVIFSSTEHLLPADASRLKGRSIYEVNDSGLHLVDQNNSGDPVSACGSAVAASGGLSESGARVFFTTPSPTNATCPTPSHVYMREDGSTTVDISVSQCTREDCNGAQNVAFAGATPSGSSVFLTTTQQLTNSDTDARRDLYRYDVDTATLVQISDGPDEEAGQVAEKLALSATDGTSVYFYAQGRLLPGEGLSSGENLYLADESGLHLVAPVGTSGSLQISRDGRIAVLSTAASLEPSDTDEKKDVYLYDADSGTLTRLSQGSAGGNGEFDADITSPIKTLGGGITPVDRALSEDGSRAFLSTAESLLSEDVNEALDVYEWADGGLALVSPGTGSDNSELAGSSADGSTVVFRTSESLTESDRDGGDYDLYAARLDGGFSRVVTPSPQCVVDCGSALRDSVSTPVPRSIAHVPRRLGRHLLLRSLEPRAGERLAAGRRVRLTVWTPIAGRISAQATMRIGRRARTIALGNAGAVRAGSLRIWLHSTRFGRKLLRRRGLLRVRLELRQSRLQTSRRLRLRLPRYRAGRREP